MKGSVIMALAEEKRIYTIEDINKLPEGTLAELIDGQIYYLASPSRTHQKLSGALYRKLSDYIDSKKGGCEVYTAPFDVFLNGVEDECLIPDISVICNPDILNERGCYGPPDWIIEITSPGNSSRDYVYKLNKYMMAGVREYWIINHQTKSVIVYFFKNNAEPEKYTFKDKIKVNIYDDLYIDFNELNI